MKPIEIEIPKKATKKKAEKKTDHQPNTPPESTAEFFKPLGYAKDETGVNRYYFYAYMSYTIISLTPGKMTKQNLMQLAPLAWWATYFPKGQSFNIETASEYLILESTSSGYFSEFKLRGRGAWIDDGRVVIHNGDKLIIDGKEHKLGSVKTEYVYEFGDSLGLSLKNPLSAKQGKELTNMISKLGWARKFDYMLISGWLGLIPICGALTWRPHIWLNAKAGSGKTWVVNNVLNRFLGNCGYKFEKGTTASGIRELYKNDALAGVHDEVDAENEKEQMMIDDIIVLLRSASASDNRVVKGTGSGANVYTPRYMFAMASIRVQTNKAADMRRFSLLRMDRSIPKEEFLKYEEKYNELCTPEFVKSFQARMLSQMLNILKSIKIFSKAIAKVTGHSGIGDQLGTMLGAWWHIESDKVATEKDAELICSSFDFTTEQALESMPDEMKCLHHIISQQIRIDGGDIRSVGEIIERIMDGYIDNDPMDSLHSALKRIGIKITDDYSQVAIAYGSIWVKTALRNTEWQRDARGALESIKGSEYKKGIRFTTGIKVQAVLIPISVFTDTIEVDNSQNNDVPF